MTVVILSRSRPPWAGYFRCIYIIYTMDLLSRGLFRGQPPGSAGVCPNPNGCLDMGCRIYRYGGTRHYERCFMKIKVVIHEAEEGGYWRKFWASRAVPRRAKLSRSCCTTFTKPWKDASRLTDFAQNSIFSTVSAKILPHQTPAIFSAKCFAIQYINMYISYRNCSATEKTTGELGEMTRKTLLIAVLFMVIGVAAAPARGE